MFEIPGFGFVGGKVVGELFDLGEGLGLNRNGLRETSGVEGRFRSGPGLRGAGLRACEPIREVEEFADSG